jgi:Tfp pilus assembly protein PilX
MNIYREYKQDEQGSVLIVALLIMVLLTVIGITVTSTTEIETQIAGNDKFQKIAFNNADSGIFPTAKLISSIVNNLSEPSVTALDPIKYVKYDGTIGKDGTTLMDEILGYAAHEIQPDIQIPLGAYKTDVDINRTGVKNLAGGAVEFGSGAEGMGAGSGGVAVFYNINSTGNGPVNSKSNITADYRKVVGLPGGL